MPATAPISTRPRSGARWRSDHFRRASRLTGRRMRPSDARRICDLRRQSRGRRVALRRASRATARRGARACMKRARCACAVPARRPRGFEACSSTRPAVSRAAIASTSTSRPGEGTRLVVTTAAAEKVYRALGPAAAAQHRAECRAPARTLAWLPQETILFDRARLSRAHRCRSAPDASLLLCRDRRVRPLRHGRDGGAGRALRPLARAARRQADLCRDRAARRRDRRSSPRPAVAKAASRSRPC